MLFSDLQFIFRILPAFLLIYYLFPLKARSFVVLIFSILFYTVNAKEYILIPILTILINYLLSVPISKGKKGPFVVSVVLDALLLIAFKLAAPLGITFTIPGIDRVAGLLHSWGMPAIFSSDEHIFKIMLPLGISFYTFKMISYQADLLKGKIERAAFGDFAAYILDFTQVISGPIGRYDDWVKYKMREERLKGFRLKAKTALSHICDGLTYFCAGLFIKLFVADHFAALWTGIGTIGYESVSTPLAWLGVIIYTFNLYYDFWGYSLMASGLGVMLGHDFVRNFMDPYAATSVSDFYRRWHMTLGAWFRDYIYIPMGGSRKGQLRTVLNLTVVWVITGFWHGVTPNFMIWAGVLLLLILWEKMVLSRNKTLLRILGQFHVIVLIPITWVVFALPKWSDLLNYCMRLVGQSVPNAVVNTRDFQHSLSESWIYFLVGIICLIPGVRDSFCKDKHKPFWTVLLFIMFWFSIYSLSENANNPFMYMNF